MLLGTPIGSEECNSDIIREKAGVLELMGDRLSLLPSHDTAAPTVFIHHSEGPIPSSYSFISRVGIF